MDPFSFMSSVDRSLLDHFTNVASRVISCHPVVQNDIRQLIIPAALQNTALFHATMALSAIHQKSLGVLGVDDAHADSIIMRFIGNSLTALRSDLQERNPSKSIPLMATIRTLFLCEVHIGGDRPRTWRAHFEGAKALMQSVEAWNGPSTRDRNNAAFFLRRWYSNTESMVALTADGLCNGQLARFSPPALLHNGETIDGILDEYTGFSTDLFPVFQEIGAAAWERYKAENDPNYETLLTEEDMEAEAVSLEQTVLSMIEQDKAKPPRFYPGLEEKLSAEQINDFKLSNEAHQQMALIQIYRRLSKLPADSSEVQTAVRRILECVDAITPTPGLSPLVVLTTAIFTAGCEATGEDRDLVRKILQRMFELLRIPNMRRSLEVLETFWADEATQNGLQDWDTFMRKNDWDFLPY